jgi:hypothetical protein
LISPTTSGGEDSRTKALILTQDELTILAPGAGRLQSLCMAVGDRILESDPVPWTHGGHGRAYLHGLSADLMAKIHAFGYRQRSQRDPRIGLGEK